MKKQPLSDEMIPLRACCTNITSVLDLSVLCTEVKSSDERNKYYSVFRGNDWKAYETKSLFAAASEREMCVNHVSLLSLCMECLPLDFQRRQPIKAMDDSRWCAVRSFDSFRRFESDIFIPFPRIWGLFACFNAMPHATARAFNPVSIHSCILTGNETNIIKALQNTHKWQPVKVANLRTPQDPFSANDSSHHFLKPCYKDQFVHILTLSQINPRTSFLCFNMPWQTNSTRSRGSLGFQWSNRTCI